MFKIKLLILLPLSIIILACSKSNQEEPSSKYSLSYIGGEYDGLLFKNLLTNHLKSVNLYDEKSTYQINAEINHESNIFITNIDNTSDRENITSTLSIEINHRKLDCNIFRDDFTVRQFYIYASSNKLLSNQKADKKIKKENSAALIKQFINKLNKIELTCNESK